MAYIRTEEVAEIRKALKDKYGKKFKFSVSRRDGGLAVRVSIVAGKTDFSALWADKAPGDYGYGYSDVNIYHVTPENYGKHAKLFNDILKIMKTAPAKAENGRAWFDESDSMTDYFHTAYYMDLSVGSWDRKYERTAK